MSNYMSSSPEQLAAQSKQAERAKHTKNPDGSDREV